MSTVSCSSRYVSEYKQIILELRAQNFDVIRFATYRTACKLRFIQKKLNLHLIDLWNVIETFRDNNLHTLDILYEIDLIKLEKIVHNMYFQLNKRLALNQHINVDTMSLLLTSWLMNLYDKNRIFKIRLFSFKIALTTLCSGKLVDKLKYIYTQISDPITNSLLMTKFDLYLKDLLEIPRSVFEEPSFSYSDTLAQTCFQLQTPIYINEFLDTIMSDSSPICFIWLTTFHRMILVQNIIHPIKCSACNRNHFLGFRYKCQKCRNYQLCQDCFWRGRVSASHRNTHQMKEYTSYKSAAKSLSASIKKSFFCRPKSNTLNNRSSNMFDPKSIYATNNQIYSDKIPITQLESPKNRISNFDTLNSAKNLYQRPIDLVVEQQQQDQQQRYSSFKSVESLNKCYNRSTNDLQQSIYTNMADEHRLISEYASNLDKFYSIQSKKYSTYSTTSSTHYSTHQHQQQQHQLPNYLNSPTTLDRNPSNNQQTTLVSSQIRSLSESNFRSEQILHEKKQKVAKLEQENRELMNEIKRLKLKQESNKSLDDLNRDLIIQSSIFSNTQTQKPKQHLTNSTTVIKNPYIIAELKTLKQRKGELDQRMNQLEQNRDELLAQLTQLEQLRSTTNTLNQRTTNNKLSKNKYSTIQSSRVPTTPSKSIPIQQQHQTLNSTPLKSRSVPSTPVLNYSLNDHHLLLAKSSSQTSSINSLNSNTSSNSNMYLKSLRQDLLMAADSVTSAMHSLVKELENDTTTGMTQSSSTNIQKNRFNYESDNNNNNMISSSTGVTTATTAAGGALQLDEDVFYFNESLLTNNEQVALWRKELEQRLLNDNNSNTNTNASKSELKINENL